MVSLISLFILVMGCRPASPLRRITRVLATGGHNNHFKVLAINITSGFFLSSTLTHALPDFGLLKVSCWKPRLPSDFNCRPMRTCAGAHMPQIGHSSCPQSPPHRRIQTPRSIVSVSIMMQWIIAKSRRPQNSNWS
jgi:hypothetical protein